MTPGSGMVGFDHRAHLFSARELGSVDPTHWGHLTMEKLNEIRCPVLSRNRTSEPGAKALLKHSSSLFIRTLYPYSRRLGTSPGILLEALRRERVPLYISPRISRQSFAFPCPVRSPSPLSTLKRLPLVLHIFPRKRAIRVVPSP